MRLLIVEDERHVRERLAEGIDWQELGIELVDAVSTGGEALAVVRSDHVDIIVTDIQMPEMSGLELAGELRRQAPYIKLIILTGYDDFEYARQGIEHGVLKYLVKPADNEEIAGAVLEAKAQREKDLREAHHLAQLESRWQEHVPHLKAMFYKGWLHGRYAEWELDRHRRDLKLEEQAGLMLPVTLDMDPILAYNERFKADDRALVQFSLYTIARDLLEGEGCAVIQDDDGMVVALFIKPPAYGEDELHSLVNQLIARLLGTVKDILKLTASAGIGSIATMPALLPLAYKHSRAALQERMVLGHDVAIPYRGASSGAKRQAELGQLEKELELAILSGHAERRQEIVARLMEEGFGPDKPLAEAKEQLLRLMCLLAGIVHGQGWTLNETLRDEYAYFESFGRLLAREQIEEWLLRMSARIGDAITGQRKSGAQLTVEEVIRYTRERLHEEELSLYAVAGQLYVNYSYLSRTFKEVTGESFSDYVLRMRMEQAKELLAKGLKVYDVAEQVGYKHVNYFSKSFQKYWGVKPSEMNK
ncbi:response regulator [Paenibacillus oryzisoli]|uniref:response regulator transcription factor n=1 Tax=Paenibacillus oryzisoli TaxID=1850517 RepID=UPI003D27CA48